MNINVFYNSEQIGNYKSLLQRLKTMRTLPEMNTIEFQNSDNEEGDDELIASKQQPQQQQQQQQQQSLKRKIDDDDDDKSVVADVVGDKVARVDREGDNDDDDEIIPALSAPL